MQSWYALNTKPQAEKLVKEVLGSRGLEPYLPLWNPPQRATPPSVARPFFPASLFVRCDLDQVGISGLAYLPGVRRLVFAGDQPARVGDRVIEELRTRVDDLNQQLANAREMYSTGERVVITDGVFAGYEALFDRHLSSGERVRVLVDFLQKRVPVEIDSNMIQRKQPALVALPSRRTSSFSAI